MSVQNVGRNRWRVIVKAGHDPDTGRPRYADKVIRGTKADAQALEASLASARVRPTEVTLDALLCRWLASVEVEANTLDYYRRGAADVAAVAGQALVWDVSPGRAEQILLAVAPGSVRRRARKALSAAMNAAVRWGLAAANPLLGLRVASGGAKRPPVESFTAEELTAALRAFHGHVAEPVVVAMAFAGLRKEEALALDWGDIDLGTGEVRVYKAWTDCAGTPAMKATKTAGSARSAYVGGYGLGRLRELAGEGPLWPGDAHGRIRPDAACRTFKRRLAAAGLRVIPLNCLRHTHATLLLASGVDVAVVSKVLGHARISTTVNAYLRPMESMKAAAASVFADALGPVGG
jgi:integrase